MWREWAPPATAWRSQTLISRVPFGVPPKKPETSQFQAFFLLFNRIWNCRILTLEHFRNRNLHWNTLDQIAQTLISCRNGRFFMSSEAGTACPFPIIPSSFLHLSIHVTFMLFQKRDISMLFMLRRSAGFRWSPRQGKHCSSFWHRPYPDSADGGIVPPHCCAAPPHHISCRTGSKVPYKAP